MGSGMKKGILFIAVCAVAVAVLYAVWPTKITRYLTSPVSTDNETGLSRLPQQSANVVRRKIPGVSVQGGTPSAAAPVVVVKKIPAETPGKTESADLSPAEGMPSVPPKLAGAGPAEKPGVQSAENSPAQGGSDQPAPETGSAAAASQQADDIGGGADRAASASTRPEKSESRGATAAGTVASSGGDRNPPRAPELREEPASHRIEGKIVPKPYSLMLASCRRLASARSVVNQGRRKGLSPYVVRVNLGEKGIWWRVYEGKYSDLNQARAARSEHNLTEALVKKTPYAIMIGLYADEKVAAGEVDRLEELEQTPYFAPAPRGKVRLLVGAFASEESARPLSDELSARGIFNKIVKR